jgi:Heavy-metal resistance
MQQSGKVMALILFICGLLVLPGSAWAVERGAKFKEYRDKLKKELKLAPDKAKEFDELGDKFMKARLDLYAELGKAMGELKKEAAAASVNEAKLTEAVNAITDLKDKLWANYQDWWHGELKLLTPVQQAHYLMAQEKWWAGMMGQHRQQMKKCMP